MKKVIIFLLPFLLSFNVNAQILSVPQTIQEQTEWCWAGVSKCILDYYGYPQLQCDIADYARTVITWHNFGSVACCTSPSGSCNYWNYNIGYSGSISDILNHFGNITSYGIGNTISLAQIGQEVSGSRPFIARWAWAAGGGHFVVGHGVSGNDVYYMNPWFGEGLHVSTYNWLLNDGNHSWTHTNIMTTSPAIGVNEILNHTFSATIFPNPTMGIISFDKTNLSEDKLNIKILNMLGSEVYIASFINKIPENLDVSFLAKGIYCVEFFNGNSTHWSKLVVE